jgi:hypothetical protein
MSAKNVVSYHGGEGLWAMKSRENKQATSSMDNMA